MHPLDFGHARVSLAAMPSIRDVVAAIGQREGVEAVVLLGHDGLAIDSHILGNLDSENLAALVPAVVDSCNRLGEVANRDKFTTGVVEFGDGLAIVSQLTGDTLLTVVVAR